MSQDQKEEVKGYCMRCRTSVTIKDAAAVWTSKGQPAVRGTCPSCGGTIFRMGRTKLHEGKSPEGGA